MPTSPTNLASLLALLRALDGMDQRELGWLYSASRHAVNYSDPSIRSETQSRLDHCVGGLAVVYLFAMFEEQLPYDSWTHYQWPDKVRLLAFRHVRHSIAHGFDGRRAKSHSSEFDQTMSSSEPLQEVSDWSSVRIWLTPRAGLELQVLLTSATKLLIGQVANAA